MPQGRAGQASDTGHATVGDIRLIWNASRQRRSTLGRLHAMSTAHRTLRLSIPEPQVQRDNQSLTTWRQILGAGRD